MKKLFIYKVLFLFFPVALSGQSLQDVMHQIEKNNTTLISLRKSTDAAMIENKTGINLQNPEIGYNYLWGNPSDIGNRVDFNVTQSFDFPTAYGFKKQISSLKNQQAETEYRKQHLAIFLQARLVCINLIYHNALLDENTGRLSEALRLSVYAKARFDAGDMNILVFNKSCLYLATLRNRQDLLVIERDVLLAELARLNGGIAIDFTENKFPGLQIPTDFEAWFAQVRQADPDLSWLAGEVEISKKQVSLNKALALPKFQAGYMSEKVVGQHFRGISIGISIPLWENKNTVKQARANALAMESMVTDRNTLLYNELKSLHSKAYHLHVKARDFRSELELYNSSALLRKAFDKGEIGLGEYVADLTLFYDSFNTLLEMEKQLHAVWTELNRFELIAPNSGE